MADVHGVCNNSAKPICACDVYSNSYVTDTQPRLWFIIVYRHMLQERGKCVYSLRGASSNMRASFLCSILASPLAVNELECKAFPTAASTFPTLAIRGSVPVGDVGFVPPRGPMLSPAPIGSAGCPAEALGLGWLAAYEWGSGLVVYDSELDVGLTPPVEPTYPPGWMCV